MSQPLADLRCAYLTGEVIRSVALVDGAASVLVRTATGQTLKGTVAGKTAAVKDVPRGTHAFELLSADGELLVEELINVRDHAGDDPVAAFATSLDSDTVDRTLDWLQRLRCTVVQIYDWMASYSEPMPPPGPYYDAIGRQLDSEALRTLIEGIKRMGGVAQAYAPVIAADPGSHNEWRLQRNDGTPETLGDLLDVMDPANPEWQQHWLDRYGSAATELGFDGFHLDTYGYPRCALDAHGKDVATDDAYRQFVDVVREARPDDVLSFNQVNGVPSAFEPPAKPGFRYVEIWPPNDRWRHFEALMARSSGSAHNYGGTLAVYPSGWVDGRAAGLRTTVLSEAIATSLGIGTMIWGDAQGALKHPYYVEHQRLDETEAEDAIRWHRFGLRCRDLFHTGHDTSWYELEDENAAVQVAAAIPAKPEPLGGTLFTRVRHSAGRVVVSLLDLSGSANGSWSEGTEPGTCRVARVEALVNGPENWQAEAAVLGRDGGRFTPMRTETGPHREGQALICEVPLVDGWSVLRLTKKDR
jgi:dextranase